MATKGGGSLLGKADSTLAQMSYREAMADVGPDLKGVYSEDVKNQAAFEKGVQDHFDALYADNNALADELKTATTKAMEGLGTDYESMELFDSHLTSMKNRMKALPKNKKGDFERSKIRAELAQLQKSSLDLDNTITKLGTMIKAGDFNENATGPDNLALFNSIASGNAKKEIVNGNLIYSINVDGKTVKMDRQALNDALVQEDPNYQSDFNKIYAGLNSRGKQKGTTFDRQLAINEYEASFPSEAAFAANIHKKQGSLKYSFAEALTGKDGSDSIYKALMDMGQTTINQYDANKDGKITNADFANKENGIALIDSLTNIHGGNFNYQAAKKAAAEFYADNISKKEFDDGVRLRTGGSGEETDGESTYNLPKTIRIGKTIDGRYQNKMDDYAAEGLLNDVATGTSFEFEEMNYSYVFNKDGGAWHRWGLNDAEQTPTESTKVGSAADLETYVFKTRHPAFKTMVTEKEEGETVDKSGKVTTGTTGLVKAFNVLNEPVDNGLAAGIFMQDDEDAATTLQALLPAGFVIRKAGVVSKFFGVDKLTITSPDGTDLGTFDFGYRDSNKALEESKRFNSNVVQGDYFRKNNIVLGNL